MWVQLLALIGEMLRKKQRDVKYCKSVKNAV